MKKQKRQHRRNYSELGKKGQISKSPELTTSLLLFLLLGLTCTLWPRYLHDMQTLMRQLLIMAAQWHCSVDQVTGLINICLRTLLRQWQPFALLAIIVVIAVAIMQSGFVWTTHPLIPDFKRLNPLQGLKKLCSAKTFFEAVKNLIKIT